MFAGDKKDCPLHQIHEKKNTKKHNLSLSLPIMLILVADISYYWQELDDTSAIILVELIVFSLFPGLVQKWTASALFVDSSISKN